MKALGYRDPMTYNKLPVIESMALTSHVLNVEDMRDSFDNVSLHQYIHELMQGKDPRKSEWFIKVAPFNREKAQRLREGKYLNV